VRIKETDTSIAMSLDGNGRQCYLDPRLGAKLLVAECCRNLACVGATPIGTTNNLNFGNPERPEIMAQLVEAIEGIAEACDFLTLRLRAAMSACTMRRWAIPSSRRRCSASSA